MSALGKAQLASGLTVDQNQCKDKNGYYHSFKTQLDDQSKVRSKSRVRRVNLG
jgi:hypothetical protein